ncbi:MAG TPA: hypothetical protein VFU16_09385 [Solirubrobacterales bacterium]|nr:hypothetical protein [Solirubrobacterales bacterium]
MLGFSAFSSTASAAPPVGRDGKIHACYKAKGKGKGTLRLVRNGKVRCPRKWKKVSWNAGGFTTPIGAPGAKGDQGPEGKQGVPGVEGNVVVKELEDKVSELLTRIEGLEDLIPAVQSLCTQAETLTGQVNAVETAVSGLGLNAVLTTLGGILEIPTLPGSLLSFSCPN